MAQEMDRRTFVQGAAAVAGMAAIGTHVALAEEVEPAEVIDTDIVIMGSGFSGLACAVQAGYNGNSVVLLEKMDVTGGNGNVVEGTFGLHTSFTDALGIDVTMQQVLDHEMASSQYRVNGILWRNFLENANQIDWLVEQGCEFTGAVETYGGLFETFHWYKDGEGIYGFVPQMTAKAEELGVEIRTSTPGKKVLMSEDGRTAVGVLAEDAEGNVIQVNAKVVVIATGGWGANPELIARQGYDVTDYHHGALPGHDGDGYFMGLEVGGMDRLSVCSQLALNYIPALPITDFKHPYNGIVGLSSGMQPAIWVNQDAKRFSNESILLQNMMLQTISGREQKAVYTLWDANVWSLATAGVEGADDDLAAAVESGGTPDSGLWCADTIEELAEKAGLDVETLAATVAEYNADAASGAGDHVFNRPAECMVAIENPPYYLARTRLHFVANFGALGTDLDFRLLDESGEPFNGLYAAGMDGEMRYRNVYPINIGGTASAGCIWSGRLVADKAKEYIG